MAKFCSFCFHYVLAVVFIVTTCIQCHATDEDRKVHIVYMGSLREGDYSPSSQHHTILQDVLESSSVMNSLVRSYRRSFNGFAAKLTDKEREKLASMNEVVSIFPSRTLQLQTTRSWDFMGLSETVKRNPTIESDVIVGVIDTGLWPESESFSDEGFSSPPKKWKGVCEGGLNFTCNNKIIGARYYNSVLDNTTRDTIGHGTHTASTAAGNNVVDASFNGVAPGTARGGVPSARIAAYKVCGVDGCPEEDILAAFDDAISDGVDIITISIGSGDVVDLTDDAVAIGSFHAMERGILTLQSAGNSGSQMATVASIAPWLLTVAASSTDRRIVDMVLLGDGTTLTGISVNSFSLNGTNFPLIYGKDVTSQCDEIFAQICDDGCLDRDLVKGKIVACNGSRGIGEADRAGALGVITLIGDEEDVSSIVPLPATSLSAQDIFSVLSYVNSTKTPQANILKSEGIEDITAPLVASFSSRGPNRIIPEIIKPDISAPGIDILAAFSPVASVTRSLNDNRSVKYNILSGTSMSCPHAAGAAAYVKSFHPDWSTSAIKSALMTTASPMNDTKNSDWEFAFGSGHIDPVRAVNPGLVYEASKDDYLKMLCSMGFNATKLSLLSRDNHTCPKDKASPKDLNYPSMAVRVDAAKAFKVEFLRTVTNVGIANSSYEAKVTATSSQIGISVEPSSLSFDSLNEKKSFVVTVVGGSGVTSMVRASLVWSDGTHSVHSPIVVYTKS